MTRSEAEKWIDRISKSAVRYDTFVGDGELRLAADEAELGTSYKESFLTALCGEHRNEVDEYTPDEKPCIKCMWKGKSFCSPSCKYHSEFKKYVKPVDHIGEPNEMIEFEFYAPVRQDDGPIEVDVGIDNARLTKAECIVNAEYEYSHWTIKPRIAKFRAHEIKEVGK